jgi:hypothetical protein
MVSAIFSAGTPRVEEQRPRSGWTIRRYEKRRRIMVTGKTERLATIDLSHVPIT